MPEPLQIQPPRPVSGLAEVVIRGVVVLPWLALAWLWRVGGTTVAGGAAALVLHAVVLLIPVAWASFLLLQPIRYEPGSDEVLGDTSYLKTFDGSWWMAALLWPAPLAGIVLTGVGALDLSAARGAVAVESGRVLLSWVVTFVVVMMAGTLIKDRTEIRVSHEGLRAGNLHFTEWSNVRRVSENGDRFDVYHAANPALPFAVLRLPEPAARALLARYVRERAGLTIESGPTPALRLTRVVVAAGVVAQLTLAAALTHRGLARPWVVATVFAVGILATLLLERYRNVAAVTKVKPVVQAPQ
jgi:hypothetical protein